MKAENNMNVGFYVDSVAATPQNGEIFEALNEAVDNKDITDASVFFNDIDYNPIKPKFGMFNSTDIWAFTGVLIATTLENVIRAAKVVNKFKLIYLYNGEEKNLLMLMDIMNVVPVFVTNSQDSDEIYRLTGKKPTNISKLSIKNILGVI
jgi:hypothetical protein